MNILRYRFRSMYVVLGIFIFVSIFLFIERMGIYHNASLFKDSYIKNTALTTNKVYQDIDKTVLLLASSKEENSVLATIQFRQILKDMKLGFDEVDVATQELPDVHDYDSVIVLLPNLSVLGDDLYTYVRWVKDGGRMLFGVTMGQENYFSSIKGHIGIADSGYVYNPVNEIYTESGFMLGGETAYKIDEPYESALAVSLRHEAKIYARTDDDKKTPLIWSIGYGKGRFVVDNIGLYTKNLRGLYAASYSLLDDQCVYPVINGQVYYIDDFPSPVPGGDATYVRSDYGMNVSEFYSKIWWPDMLSVAEEYGMKYTGGIIENYEDDTSGDVERQRDTDRFIYYGNILLAHGGELSYHGYNHQPFSLTNVNYDGVYSYNVWKDEYAVQNALTELMDFSEEMFPDTHKSVYIPPSNVLSKEGRKLLARQGEKIKSIASIYFEGRFSYTQEYEVADDGMIEQPRIVSGGLIDNYMKLAAFSEMNMHYVSSHFLHPDDTLDTDRGADKGWNMILKGYRNYVDWVHKTAPNLRHLTGSEFAGAVQRFGILSLDKTYVDNTMILDIHNFHDHAYFFTRFNVGSPGKITGGKLTLLTGDLYLLEASSEHIEIEVKIE